MRLMLSKEEEKALFKNKKVFAPAVIQLLLLLTWLSGFFVLLGGEEITRETLAANPSLLMAFLISGFVVMLLMMYVTCFKFVILDDIIERKRGTFKEHLLEAARLYPRYLSLEIFLGAIIGAPLFLMGIFLAKTYLAVTPSLILVALFLAIYLVYTGVRVGMSKASLVLEHKPIVSSIRRAFHITAHHFWHVFGILFIFMLIFSFGTFLTDLLARQTLSLLSTPFRIALPVLFIFVIFFVEVIVSSYESYYLFASYNDFIKEIHKD